MPAFFQLANDVCAAALGTRGVHGAVARARDRYNHCKPCGALPSLRGSHLIGDDDGRFTFFVSLVQNGELIRAMVPFPWAPLRCCSNPALQHELHLPVNRSLGFSVANKAVPDPPCRLQALSPPSRAGSSRSLAASRSGCRSPPTSGWSRRWSATRA